MSALEVLLSKRWILKSDNRELYYKMKDEAGKYKKFLTEKLGYQVIVNPYLVKVEKIPAKPQQWMGIMEFTEPIEYSFLCLILMFLEDKDPEDQFVLSSLTEYIQGQYRKEQIDWTVYRYRRYLIHVMKYCVANGIVYVNDGSEESFAKSYETEVLYENTGASKYFMRIFTQDIMPYQTLEEFQNDEWIDVNEDRGIVRRQRVYRTLLMTMGFQRTEESEEDYTYAKNYRNMIQGDLEELFSCDLQVYRSGAYLIMGEDSRLGSFLPEENTLSDIILLCGTLIREKIEEKKFIPERDETIQVTGEQFRNLIEECRCRFGAGFLKKYRQMTSEEFYREVSQRLLFLELVQKRHMDYVLFPIFGRIVGRFPKNWKENGEINE